MPLSGTEPAAGHWWAEAARAPGVPAEASGRPLPPPLLGECPVVRSPMRKCAGDDPLRSAPAAAPGSSRERSGEAGASRGVLIVEDDYFAAQVLGLGLADAGIPVVGMAASAAEAIEIARTEHPDLVIMDIRLAGRRDGIDAALEIFATTGIRSIFATAHIDAATRARAEPASPLAWVSKPYNAHAVIALVKRALGQPGSGGGRPLA